MANARILKLGIHGEIRPGVDVDVLEIINVGHGEFIISYIEDGKLHSNNLKDLHGVYFGANNNKKSVDEDAQG